MSRINSSQELYTYIDQDLQEMEELFLRLEKKHFSLNQLFDSLNVILNRMIDTLKQERTPALLRKIRTLQKHIKVMHREKKYEPEIFQALFRQLSHIRKLSPEEAITAGSFAHKVSLFQKKNAPTAISEEFSSQDEAYKKFLMVLDNNIRFLIPIKEKIGQKKIGKYAYRDTLTIKWSHKGKSKIHTFHNLVRGIRDKRSLERFAVMVMDEDEKAYGFLTDQVEGVIYLNPQLFLNKIEYLKVDSRTKAFIRLKGKCYFVKKLI